MVKVPVKIPKQRILSLLFLLLPSCFLALACFVTRTSLSCGLSSCMAHGHVDPTCHRLQLGTQAKLARCWTGLGFKMQQRPWAVVLILALLKTQLDFFHGEMERNGKLRTQGFKSMQINHSFSSISKNKMPFLVISQKGHFHQ